jgi:hypothetical protein
MGLPTGFLKTCKCGKLMAKSDIRTDHTCECGSVWKGFQKVQPVLPEHPALNERIENQS